MFNKVRKPALVFTHEEHFLVMDYVSLNIVLPEYERAVQRYVEYVSSKYRGSIFVDVGAHVGKYSIRMARRGWSVIALEPHPLNFVLLTLNAKINRCNIKALHVAAYSSSEKMLKFFLDSCSIVRKCDKYILVRAEAVDQIISTLNIPLNSIKLIKIDVEGAAVKVLEGMLNLLKYAKPHIIIEVASEEKDALNILKSLDYEVMPIVDEKIGHYHYYYAFPKDKG